MEKLLTAKEVAEIMQLTTHKIYELAKTGVIKSKKIGGAVRFRENDIEQFINS